MNKNKFKIEKKIRRHKRVRAKVIGTSNKPRLSVFKSNKYIYAQIIDDDKKRTLAVASSLKMGKNCLVENAKKVGTELAKQAGVKKIRKWYLIRGVIFLQAEFNLWQMELGRAVWNFNILPTDLDLASQIQICGCKILPC